MNLNHKITSLNQANNFIGAITDNQLKLNKGKDYFYFTSSKGKVPVSFMTKSIKNIWLNDLIDSIKYFNEKNK